MKKISIEKQMIDVLRFVDKPLRVCKSKKHPCFFCGERIMIDERYYDAAGKRAHKDCVETILELARRKQDRLENNGWKTE